MKINVLLVENREDFWNDLYGKLLAGRWTPFAVNSARDGLRMLALAAFDLVICDYRLRDGDGIGFFRDAARGFSKPMNILVAKRGEIDSISNAVMAGIDDIAEKPVAVAELVANLAKRL